MSHAEALQTLHPAVGATEAIVEFVNELRHAALTDEVRHTRGGICSTPWAS